MIGSGEAESRAVASAIRGAVAQSRLDAGVNIGGLLVDLDVAVDADSRQLFMCWHLTRVLRPSLTEVVLHLVEDWAAVVDDGADPPVANPRSDHVLCASSHRRWCPEEHLGSTS